MKAKSSRWIRNILLLAVFTFTTALATTCSDTCHRSNGYCVKSGECRCYVGWEGVNCEKCVTYPGCVNGDCTKPGDCVCRPGWGGYLCDADDRGRVDPPERATDTPQPKWRRLRSVRADRASRGGPSTTNTNPLTINTNNPLNNLNNNVGGVVEHPESNTADPPAFLQLFSNQHVRQTLECDVNINFTTSIWLKDGQIVQSVFKDNVSNKRVSGHRFLADAAGNLLIDTVRLEDDGRWQCEAEDALGFVVTGKPIQLTVLDPPKKPYLLIDNRILDPGNLFIPVKENSDLTVSCVVDGGNPKPTLSWDLALGSLALLDAPEVPVQALNLSETIREQRVGARSDARFERVMRAHHNATITCLVHHMALKQSLNVSLLLDVQYTPSFAISREPGFGFPIREGMPVSLKCDVDANPRASPVWQKDDSSPPVQQSADGFLNFTEIRREHSGWYKCIAKHLLGRFSSIGYFLNVRYDMEVTQEPDFDVGELSSTGRQLEVALGGAVQLACPTGMTGCWTRVDSGSGRLEPMGASQELRLEHVLYQEAGEYRCVAPSRDAMKRLDALRHVSSVEVIVTGKPMIYPSNQTITAVSGQPLTLSMEFCANPSYNKALWIANDRVYRPGESRNRIIAYSITNTTTLNCHQAVLYLSKVTAADVGEYSFIVRSANGIAESIVSVNMTYASGYNVNQIANSQRRQNTVTDYINVINILLLIMFNCYY